MSGSELRIKDDVIFILESGVENIAEDEGEERDRGPNCIRTRKDSFLWGLGTRVS